jgi:hypothetical protein
LASKDFLRELVLMVLPFFLDRVITVCSGHLAPTGLMTTYIKGLC